jgi:hypothetical protein
MKACFTILLAAFVAMGCMEFNQNEVKYAHDIIGTWSNVQWSESGLTMEKVNKLEKNTYGYIFFSNGTMLARSNSGWCGTPPIVTADYEGTWTLEDGKIMVTQPYWGGEFVQQWQIAYLQGKQVTVHITTL